MDAAMPGMDGFALCRAIKHNAASAGVPVIVLSAHNGFLDKMRGKIAGVDQYLSKPFEPSDLIRMVYDYCPVDGSTVSLPAECP
jgi:twitching motility two-component system response regulator PilG